MDIQAFRGVREGPIGQRIVVVAAVSLMAVVVVVLLAVAFAPPRPPGSVLTGTIWQWTGTMTAADVPLVVPDPADYTLEFMTDSTFRATADCITISGTYVRVLAGRTGAPWTGLRLRPDPSSQASCGPDSLSDAFLEGLRSSARYVIVDSTLTISRPSGTTMTFEVGGPAASASGHA
jgi:heat shock protein HslJ